MWPEIYILITNLVIIFLLHSVVWMRVVAMTTVVKMMNGSHVFRKPLKLRRGEIN